MSFLDTLEKPLVSDPLREVTRRERKALLIASLVSLALTWGGLFPDSIDAYGFHVSKLERTNLLFLLASVVAFLLLGFIVYVRTDLKLRNSVVASMREAAGEPTRKAMEELERLREAEPDEVEGLLKDPEFLAAARVSDHTRVASAVLKASRLRVWFEVHLPVVIGAGAFVVLLLEAGGLPSPAVLGALAAITAVASVILVLQSDRLRGKLLSWFNKMHSKILMWRLRRIQAKIAKLPNDHPSVDKLRDKAEKLLHKVIDLFGGSSKANPAQQRGDAANPSLQRTRRRPRR